MVGFGVRLDMSEAGGGLRGRAKQAASVIRTAIEQRISDGQLPPGARLEAERELATQFGTSRAAARSAVTELVAAGRITRHVGRGSFVVDPQQTPSRQAIMFPDIAPAEMMEFRCQLEPTLIDLIML